MFEPFTDPPNPEPDIGFGSGSVQLMSALLALCKPHKAAKFTNWILVDLPIAASAFVPAFGDDSVVPDGAAEPFARGSQLQVRCGRQASSGYLARHLPGHVSNHMETPDAHENQSGIRVTTGQVMCLSLLARCIITAEVASGELPPLRGGSRGCNVAPSSILPIKLKELRKYGIFPVNYFRQNDGLEICPSLIPLCGERRRCLAGTQTIRSLKVEVEEVKRDGTRPFQVQSSNNHRTGAESLEAQLPLRSAEAINPSHLSLSESRLLKLSFETVHRQGLVSNARETFHDPDDDEIEV
ncbi:hypothetical protein C8R44DRAFT_745306 [Mycena epipterygia]|nr:hypothetical protein C8R44DRAFT_745306 [Mycena epipterygia]